MNHAQLVSYAQGAAVDALNSLDELKRLLDALGRGELASDVRTLVGRVQDLNRDLTKEMNDMSAETWRA